jgi:hypothetical protein
LGSEVALFGATTPELEKMVLWLEEGKVGRDGRHGIYRIVPHEVPERRGCASPVNGGNLNAQQQDGTGALLPPGSRAVSAETQRCSPQRENWRN